MIYVEHVEQGFGQNSDGRCIYFEHVEIEILPKVMAGQTEHWMPRPSDAQAPLPAGRIARRGDGGF